MHAPPTAIQTKDTFYITGTVPLRRVLGVKGTIVGDYEFGTVVDVSLGYTEQQEWVWSLSSTLGRERMFWVWA